MPNSPDNPRSLSRRDFLKLVGVAAGSAALASCGTPRQRIPDPETTPATVPPTPKPPTTPTETSVPPTAIVTATATKPPETATPTPLPELKVTLVPNIGGLDLVKPEDWGATTTALEAQTQKATDFYKNYPYRVADGAGGDKPLWNIEISREAVPAWESKGAVIVQAKDEQGKLQSIGIWIDVPATPALPKGGGAIMWYPRHYPFDTSPTNPASPEWNRQANTIVYKDAQGKILAYVDMKTDSILEGSPEVVKPFVVAIESNDPRWPRSKPEDWFKDPKTGPDRFKEAAMWAMAQAASIQNPSQGTKEQIFAKLKAGTAGPGLEFLFSLPSKKDGSSQDPVKIDPRLGLKIVFTTGIIDSPLETKFSGAGFGQWSADTPNTLLIEQKDTESPYAINASVSIMLLFLSLGRKFVSPGASTNPGAASAYYSAICPEVMNTLGMKLDESLPLKDSLIKAANSSGIFK